MVKKEDVKPSGLVVVSKEKEKMEDDFPALSTGVKNLSVTTNNNNNNNNNTINVVPAKIVSLKELSEEQVKNCISSFDETVEKSLLLEYLNFLLKHAKLALHHRM